jgi:hypothetical protein
MQIKDFFCIKKLDKADRRQDHSSKTAGNVDLPFLTSSQLKK